MKRQYIALLIVFAALALLSFFVASSTTTRDIERQLTNTSSSEHGNNEGPIEAGNLLVYLSVTAVLVVVAIGAYLFAVKRK